jgi:flagellar hook-length control protein FliK
MPDNKIDNTIRLSKPNLQGHSSGRPDNLSLTESARPGFIQTNYGQVKELELPVETVNPVSDNKMMLTAANNQAATRLNPAILNEQFGGQSVAAAAGADKGFGSMLGNGQNTSFTQLLTQSIPLPVNQNIHKPEWGGAVGERITWMIGNKLHSAQLRISPAHLGPIEIRLRIENNLAQVSFVSNHQVVRDALEQAVPRLREMLEEQNLELADVDISDRRPAENGSGQTDAQQLAGQGISPAADTMKNEDEDQGMEKATAVLTSDKLLDTYA